MSDFFMPFCEFYKEVFFMKRVVFNYEKFSNEDLNFIQNQIGNYKFKNPLLLRQAFTRKSYSQENGGENNEVLEFYGDAVLQLVVSKLLSAQFGSFGKCEKDSIIRVGWGEYISRYNEGELTSFRKALVSKRTLSQRIDDMGLEPFLLLGKGDEKNNISKEGSVKEDLFEAILGAVALDSNWNLDKLQRVVEVMLDPGRILNNNPNDYIELIQEWTIRKYGCVPEFLFDQDYVVGDWPTGFIPEDKSSPLHFLHSCRMKLGDYKYGFSARGRSLSEARRKVCKKAYEYLSENGEINFTIRDEIGNPNEQQAISQLETLARRGYFAIPKYKFTETHDKNGNPIWQATCIIDEIDKVFNARSTSKKESKKKAAFKMLNYLLDNYDEEE